MIKRSAAMGRSGALTLEAAVVYPLMLTLVFMIIIGGMLQENPFFVPPDEFLRELRERRATHNR